MNQEPITAYMQCLHAMGDSEQSRDLLNGFAHELADRIREAQESQHPGDLGSVIDPLCHTRESWLRVSGAPAAHFEERPAGDSVRRRVDYHSEILQPFGEWEQETSSEADVRRALQKMEQKRRRSPRESHRLMLRETVTTTKVIQVTKPEGNV